MTAPAIPFVFQGTLAVPKTARFKLELSGLEYRSNPVESFGRLREMGPLVAARIPLIGNTWLATTYAAVNDVLKKDELFCRDPKNAGKRNFPMLQLMMPGLFRKLSQNMLGADEPDHRRLRSIVDHAFMRQHVVDLRPRIEEMVDEQLDHVARVSQSGSDSVDLIAELARPIPLSVICELLGLPSEDRPKFKKWFSNFANVKSFWGIGRVVPGIRKTMKYLQSQFELVKQHPRPGLISALVEAEYSGDRLSDDELLSMAMLLLLAGHETTVHLISNCILTMLQLDDVRQSLQGDWSKLDPAFEEMMRYTSPAQFGKPRWATRDMEFCGQALQRGDAIMPLIAAANYDPQRFENPDQFQIDRPQNYHLGFGAGPHVCLGLKLARTETQIVLQRLFSRWPDLQPAFPIESPDWSRRLGMRAIKTLNVRCST